MTRGFDYRPELDGVRAIAVLSVILFHVGYPDMTGGFVGVDVFFVLSGYLICGQTYLRLKSGTYSATEFFARRIRRLSTAYFACFLVTALVANALFLRSEMDVVFQGLLGSVTFTHNIILMNSAGYFAGPAHENPFLHTWSLSIEEQFYIVLPILILLTRRSRWVFARLLAVLFVVSLLLVLFSGSLIHDREARFFASFFRVWELAAGGLTFVAMHRGWVPKTLPLAALAGLVLVLWPVGLLDGSYLYPGWGTVMPVAGTVLLIAFALPGQSLVGRGLASRPMAYVGRISYGTYLWHWPLIVFILYAGVDLNDVRRAGLVVVSLMLGALSYHLIETPIRRVDVRAKKRALYIMFAVQSFVLLLLSAYLAQQPGKAERGEDAALERVKAEVMNVHPGWNDCWSLTTPETFCRVGADGADPGFFVWGDSMVNSAFRGFDAHGRANGQVGYLVPAPGCAPLKGVGRTEDCLTVNAAVLGYLAEAPAMDVFLFARWSYYAEGYGHQSTARHERLLLTEAGEVTAAENFAGFEQGLDAALAAIADRHRVIVINQVPDFTFSVPKSMLRTLRFGAAPKEMRRADFEERSGPTMAAVRAAAEKHGAVLIEPAEALCGEAVCDMARDGVPLYIDHVHFSPLGNEILQGLIEDALAEDRQ